VVGLELREQMIIPFQGKDYDLANLTETEVAHLLQFPEGFPFIQPIDNNNQATGA
jgi:hypothetical protein